MENFDRLKETRVDGREIFNGRILHVFEDTVSLPNGETATREYMRHVGAVCVIPVFENGDVLMEHQYRYPVGEVITEIPAGKLDSKSEDHLLAAQRELREETGCTAENWTSLGIFYPACAYSDEAIELYLARGLSIGERSLDDDEFLDVVRIPLADLVQQVMAGEIPDAKTQIAILKAAYLLQKEGFDNL